MSKLQVVEVAVPEGACVDDVARPAPRSLLRFPLHERRLSPLAGSAAAAENTSCLAGSLVRGARPVTRR
jgi:hypothetical protein